MDCQGDVPNRSSHTGITLDFSKYDTKGFRTECPLAINEAEHEANQGAHEARLDWIKHMGREPRFGCVNSLNGHFGALTIPECRPERLRWISYIYDCEDIPHQRQSELC